MNLQKIITVCVNKRIVYDYNIERSYEAGLILEGWEVKGVRFGNIQIVNSYVSILNSGLWLINSSITAPVFVCTHVNVVFDRKRKLLMRKNEISKIIGFVKSSNFTIIPHRVYIKNGFIKLEVCLCTGKTKFDKRDALKNKEWRLEKNSFNNL